jgi:hypothetical protein
MKTFTVAGVSRLNGVLTVRFANNMDRVKVLVRAGHSDIELKLLPTAMTKESAIQHLIDVDFANGRYEMIRLFDSELSNEPVARVTRAVKPVANKSTVRSKKSANTDDFVYKKIPGTDRTVAYNKADDISAEQAGELRAEFMKQLKAAYEAS